MLFPLSPPRPSVGVAGYINFGLNMRVLGVWLAGSDQAVGQS